MKKSTPIEIANKIQNLFGNIVSEKPAVYETKPKAEKEICFLSEELTPAEMIAIGNYQDVHPWNDQKLDWSFEIPEHWKEKAYCYVINSCCRSLLFYEMMTKVEQELIDFNLLNLDSAIEKGRIIRDIFLVRGVKNKDWLPEGHTIGTKYLEEAYGSFSLNMDVALQYTNMRDPILFRLCTTSKMKALRVDDSEFEIIRPRKTKYIIINISKEFVQIGENKFIEVTFYDIMEA
ncbi:ADP-ribosyltransferase [Methanimicrococcus sp. OttesenSCG-928-J09]|nr:ADP-ribosyltransferase [Methanimicrococcus sp. OttesenSCG-928-J09]